MNSVATTFLAEEQINFKGIKEKVKRIINSNPSKKPYQLDQKKIIRDFNKLNHSIPKLDFQKLTPHSIPAP